MAADPLTNEEMIQIFEHPDMSNNMPDGLLRRVFLWVGCCTTRRGGSYHNIIAEHFKERDDGGFNVITIHDKTHQGGYYHKTNSNQHPIHNIPPDEIGVHGACCDIKKYLKLRPRNAEANFFLRINKDPKGIDSGLNVYRKQNEKQKLTIAKLTLPSVSKKIQTRKNPMQKKTFNEAAISNAEEIDISSETEREPLSEIQNTVPSKRKNDLLFNNSKLKFIKCKNITINITK
ncbi:hypothetical protein GLOIN_2v1877809 [Rhizophagus irregularis DAOM 181602=DAOM 197198]|nr:hypothetical protein GLOIN_2v1877809 [Rhizophagus irregularis DAOM 181602=DAOM 197198]